MISKADKRQPMLLRRSDGPSALITTPNWGLELCTYIHLYILQGHRAAEDSSSIPNRRTQLCQYRKKTNPLNPTPQDVDVISACLDSPWKFANTAHISSSIPSTLRLSIWHQPNHYRCIAPLFPTHIFSLTANPFKRDDLPVLIF